MYTSIFKKLLLCVMLLTFFDSAVQAQSNTGSVIIGDTMKINYFWPLVTIPTTTKTDRVTHWMAGSLIGSTEVWADVKYGALVSPYVTAKGLGPLAINLGTTKTLAAASLETAMYTQTTKRVLVNGIPFTSTSWPLVKPNDVIRIETYKHHIMTPVKFQLDWTYQTPLITLFTMSGTDEDRGMWNGSVLMDVTEAIVSGTEPVGPPMPGPMP